MSKLQSRILCIALALLVLPAPAAAKSGGHRPPAPKRGGVYSGTSSQLLPVKLRVSRKGKVVAVDLPELLVCEGSLFYPGEELTFDARIKKRRTFKMSGPESDDLPDDPTYGKGDLSGDYRDRASGTFYGARKRVYRKVKGRFRTHLTIRDGSGAAVHQCDSGTVRFTARLVRR
jgi:hypothetical protein